MGRPAKKVEPQLEHILVSGLFTGFFELVLHDMECEQAMRYMKELREFYTAGWAKLMNL